MSVSKISILRSFSRHTWSTVRFNTLSLDFTDRAKPGGAKPELRKEMKRIKRCSLDCRNLDHHSVQKSVANAMKLLYFGRSRSSEGSRD
jgi:hypothetical protein